ncbi:uncharacterized protein LOC124845695, partial [Vigna umbellata]|uniref:uncharacterized protein LOC124845695 n=1 Tax=Vigna umbellata TaxID=87088 RepID=UPI001F5EB601
MQQIPAYAKHMKQVSTKKRYLNEKRDCSVIEKKPLPPKVKDLGSFTISCVIGKENIRKALFDLGSSINLMPLSLLKRIVDLEVKPTKVTLLMADGSSKKPYGVAEDIVVSMDKLKFLVNLMVMEMKEDEKVPIILGRPFMKTTTIIINVDDAMIVLQDRGEKVIFNVFEGVQQIQVKEASHKAACKDAPLNSSKAAKPVFK